jgi:hypothetical protein
VNDVMIIDKYTQLSSKIQYVALHKLLLVLIC